MTMKRSEDGPLDDNIYRKRQKIESTTTNFLSEWEDDFNGDILEEVCVVAELTQSSRKPTNDDPELRKLKEQLKTKEGEIVILRSKLKNQESCKRSEAVNHSKALEQLKKNYQNDVNNVKREINDLKNELEFKNLEVKGLIEKCKQLEIKSPRVRYIDSASVSDDRKSRVSLQILKTKNVPEIDSETTSFKLCRKQVPQKGEGEKLTRLVPSEFFKNLDDPCLESIRIFSITNGIAIEQIRKIKYKWVNYPKVEKHLHSVYPLVVNLCQCDNFAKKTIDEILTLTNEILASLKEVLIFLNSLPPNTEHEKAILEDTNVGDAITLNSLLGDKYINNKEYGVEARRILGVLTCIVKVCGPRWNQLIAHKIFQLLKEIATLIGQVMRPFEFSGFFVACLLLFQAILGSNQLGSSSLEWLQKTIEEIIFSRPKLYVLEEVIKTLAATVKHTEISRMLCKERPPETSTLFMDSHFHQAIFFSPDACPLKLLQIQVKTLAHLTREPIALLRITKAVSYWLQCHQIHTRPPDWLFRDDDQCCNILECFTHLLYLCVSHAETDNRFINVLEEGLMTLKNCYRGRRGKLRNSGLTMLPAILKYSSVMSKLSQKCREAALWIIADYESHLHDLEVFNKSVQCSSASVS